MKLEWKDPEPNEMSWDEAKELEKNGWRLPTRAELVDAYDNQIEGFLSDYYWSSSTYTQNTGTAWYVGFSYGFVDFSNKTYYYYVRLCREVSK
jgi:hypothetical protein